VYTLVSVNLVKNILLVRFVPGLRFIFYTSCGLFKVGFMRFLSGIVISSCLWVLCVFSVIYLAGSSAWAENNPLKWLLVPLALILLYIANRHSMHNARQASRHT
ncbi:hypothetical protein MNBD_GAMMA11-1604, partial [hydrothermal vent metagenome]